jgi:hypothetical protein
VATQPGFGHQMHLCGTGVQALRALSRGATDPVSTFESSLDGWVGQEDRTSSPLSNRGSGSPGMPGSQDSFLYPLQEVRGRGKAGQLRGPGLSSQRARAWRPNPAGAGAGAWSSWRSNRALPTRRDV